MLTTRITVGQIQRSLGEVQRQLDELNVQFADLEQIEGQASQQISSVSPEAEDGPLARLLLGAALADEPAIADDRRELLRGIATRDPAALALAGRLLLFHAARGEQLPPLLNNVQPQISPTSPIGEIYRYQLVGPPGYSVLDPILAAVVALNVLWAGYKIMKQSLSGLMDEAVDAAMEARIRAVIRDSGHGALQVHDIRARTAGRMTFIEFHMVVPGAMTVWEAHVICDRVEDALEAALECTDVSIHLEPEHKAKARGKGAVKL